MSVYSTLAELQKVAESSSSSGGGRSYFSIKPGQSFKMRFLQELTEDGKNFDEDKGTNVIVPVHASPKDFKKKLACTIEDEKFDFKCWAHEQVVSNPKWRDKKHMLMNVSVLDNNEWSDAKVFDQTFSPKHVVNSLIEYALEYGTVTNREFKITRIGSGMNDTQYTLIPLSESDNKETATLELADLTTVYRKLPYDEQIEYFLADSDGDKPAAGSW